MGALARNGLNSSNKLEVLIIISFRFPFVTSKNHYVINISLGFQS